MNSSAFAAGRRDQVRRPESFRALRVDEQEEKKCCRKHNAVPAEDIKGVRLDVTQQPLHGDKGTTADAMNPRNTMSQCSGAAPTAG